MRALFVVELAPGFHNVLRVLQGREEVLVQALFSQAAIEGFTERVLGRFPRFDKVHLNLMLGRPLEKGTAPELGAIIHPNPLGDPGDLDHILKHLDDFLSRKTLADRDDWTHPCRFINDR